MAQINANKVGLIVGAALGGWHLIWSMLIAAGAAQAILDFVFWMHMLEPVFFVEPFDLTRAAILVLVTAALGYAFGLIFGILWNAAHRK